MPLNQVSDLKKKMLFTLNVFKKPLGGWYCFYLLFFYLFFVGMNSRSFIIIYLFISQKQIYTIIKIQVISLNKKYVCRWPVENQNMFCRQAPLKKCKRWTCKLWYYLIMHVLNILQNRISYCIILYRT